MTVENKVTINDVDYDYDTLDEGQKQLINQIKFLRARIAEARFNLESYNAAEAVFSTELIKTVADDTDQNNT